MNWVNTLYDLYEKNAEKAGEMDEKKLVLLPVSHLTVAAQIEVTISDDGNFIRANQVEKFDALTIIPVTEKSGNRTAGTEPHPLCDNLKYIAGDYMKLIHLKKEKDNYSENHKLYMAALEKWCGSEYSHPKAVAILQYLKKSELIKDLISCGVLMPDEEGLISEKVKIQAIPQIDSFVRFRIETINEFASDETISDKTGKYMQEVWKDKTLQQSFIDYYKSISTNKGFCYLTGDEIQLAEFHPKKIRNEGDGAKLISANDSECFTFRGRFDDKSQAISIGYEVSQKFHNALKWIIRKQGYTRDGLCVVSFESDLKPVISIFEDPCDIVNLETGLNENYDDRFESETEEMPDVNYISAKHLNAAIEGYKANLDNTSNMVIMAFDSATTGRLSMTYFNELSTSTYLENIKYWHNTCSWIHKRIINKKTFLFEGMLSIKDTARTIYGTEQGGLLTLKSVNGKCPMMLSTFNKLMPCIINRKKIPADMVNMAVQRASSPVSYERYNWEQILSVACSLVKKQKFVKNKEEWIMSLNTQSNDRSYLYGRMLAVADRIEYRSFAQDEKGKRETNAMRYMNAFSQRPFRTWQIIEEKFKPYLNKLNIGEQLKYTKLIEEICNMFTNDDFKNDGKLDGLYLLGYHCQASELKNFKKENIEEEN